MLEKKQNAPFFNWNVGCFLQNEDKSKALVRYLNLIFTSIKVISIIIYLFLFKH